MNNLITFYYRVQLKSFSAPLWRSRIAERILISTPCVPYGEKLFAEEIFASYDSKIKELCGFSFAIDYY